MLIVACCSLIVAFCLFWLFDGACVIYVCSLLHGVLRLAGWLIVDRCRLLVGACFSLVVVWCVDCCVLRVVCGSLFVVRCLLRVV